MEGGSRLTQRQPVYAAAEATSCNRCFLIKNKVNLESFPLLLSLQKAVRVTTIMKRLRAPEQSESRAASPAAAAATPADGAAPVDPAAPVVAAAAAPEGAVSASVSAAAAAATGQTAPEVTVPAAEPQPDPVPQEAVPTSRCNGDASVDRHDAGGEQG